MRIGDTPPIPPAAPGSGDDMQQIDDALKEFNDLLKQLQEDAQIADPGKRNDAINKDVLKFNDLMHKYGQAVYQASIDGKITNAQYHDSYTFFDTAVNAFSDAFDAARKDPPDLDAVKADCQNAADFFAQVHNVFWPW